MYYINYHTGVEDDTAETIEQAMQIADDAACYTQQKITIEDENGNAVMTRYWCGVEYDPDEHDCEDPICFGSYGFYRDWTEE